MKQYIKDLIRKLYFRFCEPDIVAMTRRQLELFRAPLDLTKLPKDDREKFGRRTKDLLNNKTLNQNMDMVIDQIKGDMTMKTQPQNIIYDRFSINGISLLKEKMTEIASMNTEEDEEEKIDIGNLF